MVNRLFILLVALVLFFSESGRAQSARPDTLMNIPLIYASGGFDLSGGDMGKRFGSNYEAGAGFLFKTKTNWLFGLEATYLFGDKIKENPLSEILTEEGYLIGEDGLYADVRITERGTKLPVFKAGRLFSSQVGKRAGINSGWFVLGGIGLLQHKINYEDVSNTAPQLRDEYKKGYDRLTNGLALTQNFGYMYLDVRRKINFFMELEITEGFTKNRRDFNFNQMQKDTQNRFDLLAGVKLGWIFPAYKKLPQEYYYK